MPQWLETPAGRLALDWEQTRLDQTVADLFGFHALQLGMPELDALRANRMPYRWLALERPSYTLLAPTDEAPAHGAPDAGLERPLPALRRLALVTDFSALPLPANSLDLIVLPHTLESSVDPHAALREVGRVLVPEGRVVISGLNPASLWGLRERRAKLYRRFGFGEPYLPQASEPIGHRRLRDWLRLLSFEVEISSFGCWQPAVNSDRWLRRLDWIDRAGARWWPIFGALYFVVATKRVRGMRLVGALPPRRDSRKARAAAPVPVAHQAAATRTRDDNADAEQPVVEIHSGLTQTPSKSQDFSVPGADSCPATHA